MGSPHTYNKRFLEGNSAVIPDPGPGGTIQVGADLLTLVTLSSAGAEARNLAPPIVLGQQLQVTTATVSGTITVTLTTASGYRSTYNSGALTAWNTHTLTAAGAFFKAEAIMSASGILRWAFVVNLSGVAG